MVGLVLGKHNLGAVVPEFGGAHRGKEIPCCTENSSWRRLWLRDSLQAATSPEPAQFAGGIQYFFLSVPQQRKITLLASVWGGAISRLFSTAGRNEINYLRIISRG